MSEGILLLRLLLGILLTGHALQKLFGWFDGHGIDGTAPLFESWGLAPGRLLVVTAACSELTGSVLIATGTLTALGVAFIVGTMLVAGSVNTPNGLWANNKGYELPLIYGVLALGIGLVGPGHLSVDYQAGLMQFTRAGWVLGAAAAGVIGASPLLARVVQAQHRTTRVPDDLAPLADAES
jgi:putative oxidoreductase